MNLCTYIAQTLCKCWLMGWCGKLQEVSTESPVSYITQPYTIYVHCFMIEDNRRIDFESWWWHFYRRDAIVIYFSESLPLHAPCRLASWSEHGVHLGRPSSTHAHNKFSNTSIVSHVAFARISLPSFAVCPRHLLITVASTESIKFPYSICARATHPTIPLSSVEKT